ncbi:MAG: hypothetical protein RBR69_07970 [Candidatus Cloacimonadaceae bacterium]|nr:hypothetical protein [Candidatus Cloacimonadaceae bacterium]
MSSLRDSGHCVDGGCYLKYRPYRTQLLAWKLVFYLKYRPYRTQGIV